MEAPLIQLEHLFHKVDSDLVAVSNHLELEFARNCKTTEGCAPAKLLERIRILLIDIKLAQDEATRLAAKKKDFLEYCDNHLGKNQDLVAKMMLSAGSEPTLQPIALSSMAKIESVSTNSSNEVKGEGESQYPAGFVAVSPEEYAAIPTTTKGRAKLEEINLVYLSLFTAFRARSQGPLSIQDMTDMGLKITGTTGTAKLHCLKYLNIIEIHKNGSVVML